MLRHLLTLLLFLALATGLFAQQTGRTCDQLPAVADLALSADVTRLVQGLNPEVVSTVIKNHLGRFLGQGFPDPSKDLQQVALGVVVKGPAETQAVSIVASKSSVATIAQGLREQIPGKPEATTWVCRGLKLQTLVTPKQRSISLADLADGNRLIAGHPANEKSIIEAALGSIGDTTKSYAAAHKGAFPADALLSAHVARPASLASFPGLAKAPWGNVALATLAIRKSASGFRLDATLELTSWLKAKIVQPFIGSALTKASQNPKLPPAARTLVSRMTVQPDGKVFKIGVDASAQEIDALLLSLPGHEK